MKTTLLLNYFGQGAWIITHPHQITENVNPFYAIMPQWFLIPGVFVATAAAVIASQALISGSNAFLFLIFFLALAPGQSAFAKKDIGDIDITMSVNYGSAYRDGTWVPVDVVVKNKDFNIKGFIEVRTLSNGAMQSPRYSLPADLPKGSVKRFRFHAFLKTTDRSRKIAKAINFHQMHSHFLLYPPVHLVCQAQRLKSRMTITKYIGKEYGNTKMEITVKP